MGEECQQIEAKESNHALGKSALETISAFSNEPDLEGGFLLLGLKKGEEEPYTIKGVSEPDKVQQELANVCRHSFNIPINPRISLHSIEGQTVILAFIPEAFCRDKPVYIKSSGVEEGAFRRIGSADHRCTAHDLDLLYELRRQRHYESELLPGVSWNDISPEAIEAYRRLRAQIEPNARELALDDQELLLSLRVAVKKDGETLPTVGGLLLFGSKMALRRELPMASRVDYVVVEGSEWVEDPSARYQLAIEYRESLVTLMPRLHSQVMSDIPSKFGLEADQLHRKDLPFIPRDVIREAVANALMHRDYRDHQPTIIVRYSNRLEFKNAGYSLKPVEEFGVPGSKPRNPIIAALFHELRHAETKGTGIRSMTSLMKEAGLSTPPIIESDRSYNQFDLILLPHHLLDREALEWLSLFREVELSDGQRRALAFTRKIGAITNQDYRQLNGTDTLGATAALRRLRDIALLTQKGRGNETYYSLGPKALEASFHDKELAPQVSFPRGKLASHIQVKGLNALPSGFPELPETLKNQIVNLQKVEESDQIRSVIKKLCSLKPLTKGELSSILGRNSQHLQERHLNQMIKDKDVEYLYPKNPTHPKQAYCTREPSLEGGDALRSSAE